MERIFTLTMGEWTRFASGCADRMLETPRLALPPSSSESLSPLLLSSESLAAKR